MNERLYDIITHPRDEFVGSKPDLTVYKFYNDLHEQVDMEQVIDTPEVREHYNDPVTISYTTFGKVMSEHTPRILILHGVPTNKTQWYPTAKLLGLFAYVVCIDMVGMGKSSKHFFGSDAPEYWKWKYDTLYLRPFVRKLFGSRQFIFISDDWGSGIHNKYATMYNEDLEASVFMNPVIFDGYPVNEIQAIGRAYNLPDKEFRMAMGAFDQTLVQILKTMVYKSSKWNQYNLRDIVRTYAAVDYERTGANSVTMELNYDNIRVLAERASALSSDQLLPFHEDKNPEGSDFSAVTHDILFVWGAKDNMMPERQGIRAMNVFWSAEVEFKPIPKAGHFAGVDKPKLVAEAIMSWLCRKPSMRVRLNDPYVGLRGKWKGDEIHVVKGFRGLYMMDMKFTGSPIGTRFSEARVPKKDRTTLSRKKNVVVAIKSDKPVTSSYRADEIVVSVRPIKKSGAVLSATSCCKDE